MTYSIVEGNLLDQQVDAIVNPWNRNIIPWWLLLPQGVSGAIKKKAGYQPFRELQKIGPITLGGAVYTTSGRLPYKAIIHVAGINMFWRASRISIQNSVMNAIKLAETLGLKSVAMPIIGSGSGSFRQEEAEHIICEALDNLDCDINAIVVRYKR
ncbi:MAG: macro domain-containing protein [Armatimonadota bacterium]|nr:macro domain-containing protein [bacterium]